MAFALAWAWLLHCLCLQLCRSCIQSAFEEMGSIHGTSSPHSSPRLAERLETNRAAQTRQHVCCRLNGTGDEVGSWGNEYVRNLAGEIAAEFHDRQGEDKDVQVHITVVYHPKWIAAVAAELSYVTERHKCNLSGVILCAARWRRPAGAPVRKQHG